MAVEAAVIATVVGIAVVVGALTTLAVLAIQATRRAGDEKAGRAELAVRLEAMTGRNTDLETKLKTEQERGDALDAAIARCAAEAVGPVDGSFGRLLQAVADARRAAGRDAPVLDAGNPGGPAEADHGDPDGLLRPGE